MMRSKTFLLSWDKGDSMSLVKSKPFISTNTGVPLWKPSDHRSSLAPFL